MTLRLVLKPRRRPGALQSAVIAVIITIGTWFSMFRPVDGLIADAAVRLSPVDSAVNPRVLLIEAPIEAFVAADTDWQWVAQELIRLGADRVAFTALPTLHPLKLAALLTNPKVDAAAAIDSDARNGGRTFLRVHPALGGIDIPSVSHLGTPSLGVHRHVPSSVAIGASELPSLEFLSAHRAGASLSPGVLLIDFFAGPPAALPRVSMEQVQTGKLIPEAVQGRVALVGPVSNRFEANVVTPLTTAQVKVSELEFHAYALDTLLRGSTIRTLSVPAEVSLVALAWLLSLVVASAVRFRRAMVIATLVVLLLIILEVSLLPLVRFHFPVTAIILVVGATVLSVLQSKSRQESTHLRSLLTTTSVALANRWAPGAPSEPAAFWTHLLAMVDHLLPLTRSVLLIRQNETDQLRVEGTLRCAPDAVLERRRDTRRPPFLQAQSADGSSPAPQFFRDPGAQEVFLMQPLKVADRPVGFWVFGIDESRINARPALAGAFQRVADEMAEAIVEHWAKQDTAPHADEAIADRDLQRLADNLRAIDRHFQLSEHIFMGLRTPTVVFDVFGRTIAMNEQMKNVFQKSGDLALASAPYVLETLCHLAPESAREALAGVVFEGHEFEHTASCGEDRYMLHATALLEAPGAQTPGADRTVQGLQIELLPFGPTLPSSAAAADQVDVWDALERAVGRIAAMPKFESLEIEMDGERQLPAISARPQSFTEAVGAAMRLLAEDASLPGTLFVAVRLNELESRREVLISLTAKGFGIPPDALHEALTGARVPASGPLRQIRTLRDTAFRSGSIDIQSELGQGYRVRIAMPVAVQ